MRRLALDLYRMLDAPLEGLEVACHHSYIWATIKTGERAHTCTLPAGNGWVTRPHPALPSPWSANRR